MSLLVAGGDRVLSARFAFPLVGAWTAQLRVDGPMATTGRLTIEALGRKLEGYVYRAGVVADAAVLAVVGGRGGLSRELPARAFRDLSLGQILADALREAGEVLAPSSSPVILGRHNGVARWHRLGGVAFGTELARLLEQVDGARWRMTDAGEIDLHLERWSTTSINHVVSAEDPSAGRLTIAGDEADLFALRPGVVLDGRALRHVVLEVSGSGMRASAEYRYAA